MGFLLNDTHAELVAHLEAKKLQIQHEVIQRTPDADPRRAAGDHRALRGIPAIGRGAAGCITDQDVPGSDEHLDQMDVA